MPSPKLTASLPLKIDAWKTILCFWEEVFSGVMLVSGRVWNYGWSTSSPPQVPPLRNRRPYFFGLIIHWFPLIRPAIKPLFRRGGRLTSHDERFDWGSWSLKNDTIYPTASMYGIFTYIYFTIKNSIKCRQIYHTWMLWVSINTYIYIYHEPPKPWKIKVLAI